MGRRQSQMAEGPREPHPACFFQLVLPHLAAHEAPGAASRLRQACGVVSSPAGSALCFPSSPLPSRTGLSLLAVDPSAGLPRRHQGWESASPLRFLMGHQDSASGLCWEELGTLSALLRWASPALQLTPCPRRAHRQLVHLLSRNRVCVSPAWPWAEDLPASSSVGGDHGCREEA